MSETQPSGPALSTNPEPPKDGAPEPPYSLILDGLRRRRVIPFLGAGASLAGRPPNQAWTSPDCGFLPSARELAEFLDGRSGFPSTELAELTRVAQYFDGVAGRGGLDDQLHQIFARAYQPGPIHEFLAGFDGLLLITTNYDDLVERALRAQGRPFHVVTYQSGTPELLVLDHGASEPRRVVANELDFEWNETSVVFKMHGTVDPDEPERDSYVITEDDYVEFLARMASKTAIPAAFAELFRRSHFLFLGYGLRDWNLRVILHKIWQEWPRRRYASWAIQHRSQALEREFWSRRLLTIYELTLDDFVARLRSTTP